MPDIGGSYMPGLGSGYMLDLGSGYMSDIGSGYVPVTLPSVSSSTPLISFLLSLRPATCENLGVWGEGG
eukprot:1178967-Rhodomonas_salina.5